MLPITVMILLQDYMYFDDFRSLSEAHYITMPNAQYLIDKYCALDIPNKLRYLIDRLDRRNMDYVFCLSALQHNSYLCIKMLMKDHGILLTKLVYEHDMIDIFNYLKLNNLVRYFDTLHLRRKNRVLEALIQLYEEGTLYKSSLYYELEQLGEYDLIDRIKHVYY